MCQRMWCTCEVVVLLINKVFVFCFFYVLVDMVGVNGQNWPITGYTRSWYTGMMSVLKTMLTGSTYPSFPSSPADFAQLFSMRFPHYLGAWNRLRVIRNSCKWRDDVIAYLPWSYWWDPYACWSNTCISKSTKALSMNFSHTFSNRMKLYKIKLHFQSASFSLQDFSVFTVIFLTVKNSS